MIDAYFTHIFCSDLKMHSFFLGWRNQRGDAQTSDSEAWLHVSLTPCLRLSHPAYPLFPSCSIPLIPLNLIPNSILLFLVDLAFTGVFSGIVLMIPKAFGSDLIHCLQSLGIWTFLQDIGCSWQRKDHLASPLLCRTSDLSEYFRAPAYLPETAGPWRVNLRC